MVFEGRRLEEIEEGGRVDGSHGVRGGLLEMGRIRVRLKESEDEMMVGLKGVGGSARWPPAAKWRQGRGRFKSKGRGFQQLMMVVERT